ncbi:sigma-54 interaction domain-containing protein [Papillibacter cinnamivorans]|uniref:PAS domain S-box-containing protein n=1 Tax=Papillibacter cinnamivorans DSM 12816 TaxID=1122930 RepID=A0A1W2A3R9_9FIRM|nr:sigma 54-interacting transcriptional regulator [Papillibacter cinnamivorans]SMC55389.1 PAS domain S-box-containing protein [Papillibacter cinnamivorans DSM 12816]
MELSTFLIAALNSIDDGFLMIDRAGRIVFASRAYEQLIGLRSEQIVGRLLLEMRPGARLKNVMDQGQKQKYIKRVEGAQEYVTSLYPIVHEGEIIGGVSVGALLKHALENSEMVSKYKHKISELTRTIKDIQRASITFDNIVAKDLSSLSLQYLAKKVARKNIDILITGESGTGKEMYAQAIHNASERREESFIAVNCAALQNNLLESELFGYEEGAFTGARKGGKAGLFEAAEGGTMFLDEISELPYDLQAKVLRVLQEKTVRRVGGTKEIPVNVRVIAASNVDLESRIAKGIFREDLYYRIAVFPIEILPLRKRPDDILPMAGYFLRNYETQLGRRIDISEEARKALLLYEWPGNIRELKNAIDFAATLMNGFEITLEDLPQRLQNLYAQSDVKVSNLKVKVKAFEKKQILHAIDIYGDTLEGKKQAAEALGISLTSLYGKLQDKASDD